MNSANGSPLSIAAPVRAVLEIFEDTLAEVRFPDLDRDVLDEHRQLLEEARLLVQQRQTELDAARAELEARRKTLTNLARRAQRYALVFAEGDDELRARLEAIEFESKAPKRARKPRRRSEKTSAQLALAKDATDAA